MQCWYDTTSFAHFQITAGEMISLLPIRGAIFMLPCCFLNKQLVRNTLSKINSKGLACGYVTVFGFCIDIAQKAAIFGAYVAYWNPTLSTGARVALILVFLFVVLGINLMIIPYYGATEFYLTVFKVVSISGIIIAAIVVAAGGAPTQLLGTSHKYRPIPCDQNQIADSHNCLEAPGFGSTCPYFFPLIVRLLEHPVQVVYLDWCHWPCDGHVLLPSSGEFLIHGKRNGHSPC